MVGLRWYTFLDIKIHNVGFDADMGVVQLVFGFSWIYICIECYSMKTSGYMCSSIQDSSLSIHPLSIYKIREAHNQSTYWYQNDSYVIGRLSVKAWLIYWFEDTDIFPRWWRMNIYTMHDSLTVCVWLYIWIWWNYRCLVVGPKLQHKDIVQRDFATKWPRFNVHYYFYYVFCMIICMNHCNEL